jgi:hypothetical protein
VNELRFILVGVGYCVFGFLLAYGVIGGLIQKRILQDAWRQTYVTGTPAVVAGLIYIIVGLIGIWIDSLGLVDLLRR